MIHIKKFFAMMIMFVFPLPLLLLFLKIHQVVLAYSLSDSVITKGSTVKSKLALESYSNCLYSQLAPFPKTAGKIYPKNLDSRFFNYYNRNNTYRGLD